MAAEKSRQPAPAVATLPTRRPIAQRCLGIRSGIHAGLRHPTSVTKTDYIWQDETSFHLASLHLELDVYVTVAIDRQICIYGITAQKEPEQLAKILHMQIHPLQPAPFANS